MSYSSDIAFTPAMLFSKTWNFFGHREVSSLSARLPRDLAMIRNISCLLLFFCGVTSVEADAFAAARESKAEDSSSGWVEFATYTNFGIYLPVKINGHESTAFLYGGPPKMDSHFADSLGIMARGERAYFKS
jgi:hypothetical protein